MFRFKLATKILLNSIAYITIFGALVIAWLIPAYNKGVWDLAGLNSQHLVEAASNILSYYNEQAQNQKMTLAEAQGEAAAILKKMKYQADGYFFVINLEPRMIVHPDASLVGQDVSNQKDLKGRKIFVEIARLAQDKGADFIAYEWQKSGAGNGVDATKLDYIKLFKPWKWVIATGVYINDAKAEVGVNNLSAWAMIIFMTMIGGGLLTSFLISRAITRPFNSSINNLTRSAEQVAAASAELSTSSQQLSSGSAEQAAALEETSSTLEESASMIQQNTEHTKQAALLAKQAKELSDKGNQEMQEMITSMAELKKSSTQIAKIIKVIDDIAFQTNILALNAAIEAARAGEAGMGFAVVAEEVRNLAQRSAQAAKDTTAIIESNIDLSDKGTQVVEMVKASLAEIALQIKKVSELMEEIAAASQEQYQGIAQVNQALAQVETVTQQNSSTADESAAASAELYAQAQSMMNAVRRLSGLINGEKTKAGEAMDAKESGARQAPAHTGHLTASNTKLTAHPVSRHRPPAEVTPEDIIPLEKDKF
ncbi:MAG: cache domain-containing protein [Firmicutes bacterium]|nr:cache domain-containing protein [Bacillota bacterium]